MADAFKCDRCKGFYDYANKRGVVLENDKQTAYKVLFNFYGGGSTNGEYDLCDNCITDLLEVIIKERKEPNLTGVA